jgi:putative endonuclease
MPGYVYLLASRSRQLYVGVTNNLPRRIFEHRAACDPNAFTAHYRIFHLVHVEVCDRILDVIAREKQIKSWSRAQKIALIQGGNPDWQDLMPF